MSIQWNKVTWYSKLLAVVLAVLIFYVGFYLGQEKKEIDSTNSVPAKQIVDTAPSISIKTQDIKEENFTGKIPIISGSNILAKYAQTYIDETVHDFKTAADPVVPEMRQQFGADSPTANYEIDIDAKYIKSVKTESIVMTVYTYTGGAHGSSFYKTFTASISSKKILSLSDIIKTSEQTAFAEFVKKELKDWIPGSDSMGFFVEAITDLKFDSFTSWSIDDKNLTIYFDQYEIGPGAMGLVPFPISLDKIKSFLN